MSVESDASLDGESRILTPNRPLAHKYLEPILFLAGQMSSADGQVAAQERKVLDDLAQAANMKHFRREKWYRDMSEEQALNRLDIDLAKTGALVVMALVLKADDLRHEDELAYFSRIRQMLDINAVYVPEDVDTHKQLALRYFAK
ncbi:MAG: hypothetical protein OEV94_04445 [Deltaproteobacteria bacterium]|nr:hypothetical protein [Deltaproteobacteria bacterium]